jgi:hypothetical protein
MTSRPAGMCQGAGHLVVYGNAAFREIFGAQCVGLPAREGLLGLPADAFATLDAAFRCGTPLARWIRLGGYEWRLTTAPRRDPGTDAVYGVAFHLRRRDDLPVVATPSDRRAASPPKR